MKSGTNGLCIALVLAACVSTVSAQSNRAFSAGAIGNGVTAGNNISADTVGNDPIGPCGIMTKNVWYTYTASCNGTVTVSTCAPGNSSFDTVLEVYDGACGPFALSFIACNDDAGCGYLGFYSSTVTFLAAAGGVYYISLGGYNGDNGTFGLSVACVPTAGAPGNDNCAGAYGLPLGRTFYGTNVGATDSNAPGCGPLADVWYTFTAPSSGNCTVTTCGTGTGYDTYVSAFSGTCAALTWVGTCNDDAGCGVNGLSSSITFAVTNGTQYFLSIGGYAGLTGRFALKVSIDTQVELTMFDQGPGTVGFRIGDSGGNYYFFVTTSGTNFPYGWFYGINMTWSDVISQATGGFPFQGGITNCGTVGPFGPLPSGFTVYAVAMAVPAIGGAPTAVSAPVSFTTL